MKKKTFVINGEEVVIKTLKKNSHEIVIVLNDQEYSFHRVNDSLMKFNDSNLEFSSAMLDLDNRQVLVAGVEAILSLQEVGRKKSKLKKSEMNAPMPGKVFKILKKVGDSVKAGDALLVLEAMKMEHTIKADKDGVISEILFAEGDMVTGGAELVKLKGETE